MKHASKSITLLCFPPVDILDVAGPLEVFRLVNLLSKRDAPYQVTVVNARDEEMIEAEAGVRISSDATIAQLAAGEKKIDHPDTLIVASGLTAINRYPPAALKWMVQHSHQFRRICSVCLGAFPLAAAGLLNNRRATTHWRMRDLLSRLHNTVVVEDMAIWVKDGKFYTSAGLSTGIDLTLGLVEEDLGHALANDVAKEMVLFIRRPAEQSQNSRILEHQNTPSRRLQTLQPGLLDNLDNTLDTDRLAERLAVSRRTLIRMFRSELNTTPARHIESLRLDAMVKYMRTTDWSLEQIAKRCGFTSADVMRRAFLRKMSLSLAEYRRTLHQVGAKFDHSALE